MSYLIDRVAVHSGPNPGCCQGEIKLLLLLLLPTLLCGLSLGNRLATSEEGFSSEELHFGGSRQGLPDQHSPLHGTVQGLLCLIRRGRCSMPSCDQSPFGLQASPAEPAPTALFRLVPSQLG